jgi:hypothetical protein
LEHHPHLASDLGYVELLLANDSVADTAILRPEPTEEPCLNGKAYAIVNLQMREFGGGKSACLASLDVVERLVRAFAAPFLEFIAKMK